MGVAAAEHLGQVACSPNRRLVEVVDLEREVAPHLLGVVVATGPPDVVVDTNEPAVGVKRHHHLVGAGLEFAQLQAACVTRPYPVLRGGDQVFERVGRVKAAFVQRRIERGDAFVGSDVAVFVFVECVGRDVEAVVAVVAQHNGFDTVAGATAIVPVGHDRVLVPDGVGGPGQPAPTRHGVTEGAPGRAPVVHMLVAGVLVDPFWVSAILFVTGRTRSLPVQTRCIAANVDAARTRGQARAHVDGGEGVAVVGAAECGCVHLTGLVFQLPVAAGYHAAGSVVTRGHIGPGQCRHLRDERLTDKVQRHVAAVQHQVAAVRQEGAQSLQVSLAAGHGVSRECERTQLHLPIGAVGEEVDGFEILLALQCLCELGQTIAVGVDADNRPLGRYIGQQLVGVGHGSIDHDDLSGGVFAEGKGSFSVAELGGLGGSQRCRGLSGVDTGRRVLQLRVGHGLRRLGHGRAV